MPRVADRSIVAGGIRICILTVSYLWNSMETVEYCSAMDRRFGSVHSNVGGRRSQRSEDTSTSVCECIPLAPSGNHVCVVTLPRMTVRAKL